MIQPSQTEGVSANPEILRRRLTPLCWAMYELLYQHTVSFMLPTPTLEHIRTVHRSNCGLLLACAAVKARKNQEGYYYLDDKWPILPWPTYVDLPEIGPARIKSIELRDVRGPTPGSFLSAMFAPDLLCALSAERAIEVVFGLAYWGHSSHSERDRVPMVAVAEVEETKQAKLTGYGQATLRIWRDYGLADSAEAMTKARNRLESGAIELKEAVREVVDDAGFPSTLADKAHSQMVAQISHFRSLINPPAGELRPVSA